MSEPLTAGPLEGTFFCQQTPHIRHTPTQATVTAISREERTAPSIHHYGSIAIRNDRGSAAAAKAFAASPNE